MKKQNLVMLTGVLKDCASRTIRANGLGVRRVLVCRLQTDKSYYGGIHLVEFPENLIPELMAFRTAAGSAPLEITVNGWLRSFPDRNMCSVVVDVVMYHVDGSTREKARSALRRRKTFLDRR